MDTPELAGTTPAVAPTPAQHASKLHTLFADLEKLIGLATDPAIMAFLPAKYQAYAGAALVIEQVVTSVAGSASSTSSTPAT